MQIQFASLKKEEESFVIPKTKYEEPVESESQRQEFQLREHQRSSLSRLPSSSLDGDDPVQPSHASTQLRLSQPTRSLNERDGGPLGRPALPSTEQTPSPSPSALHLPVSGGRLSANKHVLTAQMRRADKEIRRPAVLLTSRLRQHLRVHLHSKTPASRAAAT